MPKARLLLLAGLCVGQEKEQGLWLGPNRPAELGLSPLTRSLTFDFQKKTFF